MDSGRTTTVVSGLDKYSEYSLQVLAYTVKDGPWSVEIKTKTKEDGIVIPIIILMFLICFCLFCTFS